MISQNELISRVLSAETGQSQPFKELCKCLLGFEGDSRGNIDALLKLGGELFEADFLLVNHFQDITLKTLACWNAPTELTGNHPTTDGTLCGDLLKADQLVVIRDLEQTPYRLTESAVLEHGLRSYIGHPVRVRNKTVGTICLLYRRDYEPRNEQLDLLGIIAAVIGIEIERHDELSERQKVQEALRASEEKYRALTENNSDVIMRFDTQLRHLYVNRAVKVDTGIDAADFIGKTHPEMGFPQHLVEQWEDALKTVFRTGRPHQIEFAIESPNGSQILDWHLNPEFDSDGSVSTVMTTARNITDRKAAEKQKELLLRELHQAKKMEAIGLLAAGVAHELNNPLCAIAGYAELLLKQDLPEDALRRTTKISKQSQRCQAIVDDLLLYSRQHAPRLEHCQLWEVARHAIQMGEYQWRKAGVNVILDGDQSLWCSLDAPLIEQALINLIKNGVEASAKGQEVRVSVESEDEGYASIVVSDDGIGLNPDVRESMFTPFFTTKGVGEGTGLGLSIVQGIVDKHQGRLHVVGHKDQGASIRIIFPTSGRD